jgi:hypothetical protein
MCVSVSVVCVLPEILDSGIIIERPEVKKKVEYDTPWI